MADIFWTDGDSLPAEPLKPGDIVLLGASNTLAMAKQQSGEVSYFGGFPDRLGVQNSGQSGVIPTLQTDPAQPENGQIWINDFKLKVHFGGQTTILADHTPTPTVITLDANTATTKGGGWTNPNNSQRPNALQQGWFAWQYLGWPWNEPTGQYKIEMECNPIRLDATVTTGSVDLAVSPLIQFHWPEVVDNGNIGTTWQIITLSQNCTITNGQTLRFGVSRNNPISPVLSKLIITKL